MPLVFAGSSQCSPADFDSLHTPLKLLPSTAPPELMVISSEKVVDLQHLPIEQDTKIVPSNNSSLIPAWIGVVGFIIMTYAGRWNQAAIFLTWGCATSLELTVCLVGEGRE